MATRRRRTKNSRRRSKKKSIRKNRFRKSKKKKSVRKNSFRKSKKKQKLKVGNDCKELEDLILDIDILINLFSQNIINKYMNDLMILKQNLNQGVCTKEILQKAEKLNDDLTEELTNL